MERKTVPLISLCMIVRDEEELLSRCLDSIVAYADETIVVDTGSIDATRDVAEQCGARVVRHGWRDDFAAARNAGLAEARGRFVLVLDADEWIEGGCTADELRTRLEREGAEAYTVTVHDRLDDEGERSYPLVRLFRNRPEYRYEGEFHEQITPSIARAVGVREVLPEDSGLVVGHDGYRHERRASRGKAERNLRMLRRKVERNPGDAAGRYFLIRELVPMRGGRAVPGRHLLEALEECERLASVEERLSPAIAADFVRLHAAALLAEGVPQRALELLNLRADDSTAFELLRADAEIAIGEAEGLERALDRARRCFDRPDRGSLPAAEPALAGPLARVRAVEALLRLGRAEEARTLAYEATRLPGGGAAAWRAAAAVERASGGIRPALEAYRAGLRADPRDPWVWAGIGEVMLQIRAWPEAVEPLSNAATLAPGWREAEEALATALLLADRPGDVLERFDADREDRSVAGDAAVLLASAALMRSPRLDDCGPAVEESIRRVLRRVASADRGELLERLGGGLSGIAEGDGVSGSRSD